MTASRIATSPSKIPLCYIVVYNLLSILCRKSPLLFRLCLLLWGQFHINSQQTTTFPAPYVMLSSSRNQQLYPTGIFPYLISYTMKKNWKTPKQMADSFWCFTTAKTAKRREYFWCVLWLPFVITQAERRTRGLLRSVGRDSSPVCLWGDYCAICTKHR